MNKRLESPVKEFPGHVVIPDRLTMPQVILWENSVKEQRKIIDAAAKNGDGLTFSAFDSLTIPIFFEIVQEWHVDGLFNNGSESVESFNASPRKASHDFIAWLGGEIRKVYEGEVEIKNE